MYELMNLIKIKIKYTYIIMKKKGNGNKDIKEYHKIMLIIKFQVLERR